MNTCNQCKTGINNIVKYRKIVDLGNVSIGKTNAGLCADCRVKAEIELRDFIKQSKYFTELMPFG